MHLNITDSEKGDNKGSSGQLVHYLDKENRIFSQDQPEPWFNATGEGYAPYLVRNALDRNVSRLCHKDAKFFLVNISPSQKEIAFLKVKYGEKGAKAQLKAFAVRVMDEYARTFKRPGIDSNLDLLWYAKLENHRYYSYKDKEVKNGTARRGDPKPGEQMHIQVVVSRKDIRNRLKLSPENTSRGRNVEHSKKLGQFDRVAFKQSGERVFDETFGFQRPLSETFRYANAQVNGSLAERIALAAELRLAEAAGDKAHVDTGQGLSESLKQQGEQQAQPVQGTVMDVLLARADFVPGPALRRKKKRKKGSFPSQELSL